MYDVATQIIIQLCVFTFLYIIYTILSFTYIGKNTYLYNNSNIYDKKHASIMFSLLLLMCTICNNNGDYYTYRNWFLYGYGETAKTDEWIEPIYYWIKAIIPFSYLFFRLAIWGTGIYIYKKLCEKAGVNILLSYILFGIFYIFAYSYARASLGIAITCYAFILLVQNRSKKVMYYIKIVLLFLLATLLHKTCISLIIILLLSQILKLNTKTLFLLAILFIPLSKILNSNLDILGSIVGLSEYQTEKYLNADNEIYERSSEIKKFIPLLILLFFSIRKIFVNKKSIPYHIERIVMGTISILYVAALLTTLSIGLGQTIALRFYLMAFIFALICCAYAIQNLKMNKLLISSLMIYNVVFYCLNIYIIIKYGASGLVVRYYY